MKKVLAPVLLFLLIISILGCAGSKGKIVSSYELAGAMLKTAYQVAKPACDSGTLSTEDCAKVKQTYNQARASYLLAGDLLVLAMETEDLASRQATLEEYQELANTYTRELGELIRLLTALGILEGK